jgi:hypothetical protein
MGLASCRGCRYWLRADDVACPDCGLAWAHPGLPWKRRLHVTCIAIGAGVAALATAIVAAGWVPLILALVGGEIGHVVHDAVVRRRLRARVAPGDCLTGAAAALAGTIADTDTRLARLVAARASIEEVVHDADRAVALEVTDSRAMARLRELDALTVRLWQIDFARWANRLLPVIDALDEISYDEADRRLAECSGVRRQGLGYFDHWRRDRAAASPEGREFLARFRAALAGVDTIRKELALRKALLADPDASHLGRAPQISAALEGELQRFTGINDDVAAGRYGAAGSAMHDEHDRLAGELEIERALPAG